MCVCARDSFVYTPSVSGETEIENVKREWLLKPSAPIAPALPPLPGSSHL